MDASTEWGVGGLCGSHFFLFPWTQLGSFGADIIARRELLACLIATFCFAPQISGRIVKLWSDNVNAVHWLQKGRYSNVTGTKYLACLELQKYRLKCKISPRWLPGNCNRSADALSRGHVPQWLEQRGVKQDVDLESIVYTMSHAELSWESLA